MDKYRISVTPLRESPYVVEISAYDEKDALKQALRMGMGRDYPQQPWPAIYAWDVEIKRVEQTIGAEVAK